MHQAARDDIGPELVRAARRDNLSGWVNYKSRPGDSHLEHRDERPGSNYGKVSYSYPFLPYRKLRALRTQP
jgi:hypothetical protein